MQRSCYRESEGTLRRFRYLLAATIALAWLLSGCVLGDSSRGPSGVSDTPRPLPSPSASRNTPEPPKPRPTSFTTTRPVPPGAAPNITANQPGPNSEVKSPLRIEGKASVFEANVQFAIRDAQGKEIGKGFTTASRGAPEWGDYSDSIPFSLSGEKQQGTVEVFTLSARDGKPEDVLTIPVVLVPGR